jgi:protein transport protein SEC61 subunit gamma-like protein
MEVADIAVKPVKEFAKDSYRLVRKCTKPDRKEFTKIALRTGLGFVVMGFVGFFVKLILCVPPRRSNSTIVRPILPPLGPLFRSPAPNVPLTPHPPPSPRSIPINNIILAA